MEPIYIENVLLNEKSTNILIENSMITGIGTQIPMLVNAIRIDGRGKAAFPSFANMHTHAAMTLLKGLGSDLPLQQWLNDSIWPAEKHLDGEAVYWGVKLACLEMIKSGTTLFNDMYFHLPNAAKAVAEMGIRGILGINVFGDGDELTDDSFRQLRDQVEGASDLLKISIAPHSVYTVSEKGLVHCAEMSHRYGTIYQIHLSETEREVQECLATHNCRPYELLERTGVLELTKNRLVGAHSLYLSREEIDLMARHHVTATHNPASNLKLGSGYRFLYSELREAGVNVTLGTDGSASSNNLDMIEAARLMSYLQKGVRQDPTVL
ncbi:MAG: amidohydrolase family protein, partial [Bacteroidales bacterium]|nr:amidohydrolase family protein [Bacteroidales bacterium]